MSDPVLITLIVVVALLIILVMFRDRVTHIKAKDWFEITLADKQIAKENMRNAELKHPVKPDNGRTSDRFQEPEGNVSLSEIENRINSLTYRIDKTILWVDDHPENNTSIVNSLDALGIHVQKALSNDEARQSIGARRPSLVITDIGRDHEEETGLDLARETTRQQIPTIIYSASSSRPNNLNAASEMGVLAITSSPSKVIETVIRTLQ